MSTLSKSVYLFDRKRFVNDIFVLGYDGTTTSDWEDYSRYMNTDGVDMSHVRKSFFII